MGRLFWKILLGFWLTLFVLGAGVAVGITLYRDARTDASSVMLGRRADFLTGSMAWALQHAEPNKLNELVKDWPNARPNSRDAAPLVVDEAGHDIIGRQVSASVFEEAQVQLTKQGDSDIEAIKRVKISDGRSFLIFTPAGDKTRSGPPPIQDIRMGLAIMAVLAGLAFSAILARNLVRPIRKLRNGFDALARGELDTRVGPSVTSRRDELGDLGRDFDRMAQQLHQLVSARRRLLHDVSHELRSPLARLQVAVGLARQQPQSIESSLDRIERESQRLDALVGEILTIARIQAGAQASRDDYIDLIELLQTIVEDARFEAGDSGKRIRVSDDVEGELILRGQGELLHRAFENVIRNAVRHTTEGSEVGVSITVEPATGIVIKVSDNGPGVPESELQTIFEPFYRSVPTGDSNEKNGGYGLGLAIARHAIEAHGGHIKASNRPNGGLVIEIVLPLPEQVG